MTIGSLTANILLVPLVFVIAGILTGRMDAAVRGTLPAVTAAVVLLAGRTLLYTVAGSAVFDRLGFIWLLIVVVVEEAAKFAGAQAFAYNRFFSQHQNSDENQIALAAVAFGAGFASVEHLLFLFQPTSMFLVRLVFATSLHVGTTWLYMTRLSPASSHMRRVLFLFLGVIIHLSFNVSLDFIGHLTFS